MAPFYCANDNQLAGFFVSLSDTTACLKENKILAMEKIISATRLANDLGAAILGMGGYTSILYDQGYTAFRSFRLPVTSGSTYIAWSAFEAVYRIARAKRLALKESKVLIIGASTAVGSLCSRKLSGYLSGLTITSSDSVKLEKLKEIILQLNPINIKIEPVPQKAIQDADMVIFADDDAFDPLGLDLGKLKAQAIVFDATVDKTVSARLQGRSDITLVKCGLIKTPSLLPFPMDLGLPKGIIPAGLAETILLAAEGKICSYSAGDNINLDKMDQIADIAARYGFEVWLPEAPIL